MTKGQRGNKEAEEEAEEGARPNPPGLPANLAPTVANALRPKKR